MNINFFKSKALLGLTVIIGLASCSKDKNNDYTPNNKFTVQLANTSKFGSILTDKDGRSLYSFAVDAAAQSNCNGNCAVTWPAFYDPNPALGTGLNSADFGVITRADNSKQTTYKGWPLYYFSNDNKAGDTNGDGVGKTWFIAKPDYTVMFANQQLLGKDGVKYNSRYQAGDEIVQYLTDDRGHTLYSFSNDVANTNKFTKSDFSNNSVWPIYEVANRTFNVPSTLDKSLFSTITVFGKTQLTFKGWPLYFYGGDAGVKGSNKGVSVPTPGIWPVQNKDTAPAPAAN